MDQSSPADPYHPGPTGEAPLEQASRAAQKADAFMDMVAAALAVADRGHAAGDDRYMVHIVTRDDGRSFSFGHCRFPGCQFRHYDLHHLQAWEADGLTDVDNGFCQCRRHHRLLHSGYQV